MDEAVKRLVREQGRVRLRKQLERGAKARATRDRNVAAERILGGLDAWASDRPVRCGPLVSIRRSGTSRRRRSTTTPDGSAPTRGPGSYPRRWNGGTRSMMIGMNGAFGEWNLRPPVPVRPRRFHPADASRVLLFRLSQWTLGTREGKRHAGRKAQEANGRRVHGGGGVAVESMTSRRGGLVQAEPVRQSRREQESDLHGIQDCAGARC